MSKTYPPEQFALRGLPVRLTAPAHGVFDAYGKSFPFHGISQLKPNIRRLRGTGVYGQLDLTIDGWRR